MEYILGSASTLIAILVMRIIGNIINQKQNNFKIRASQSRTYHLMAPFISTFHDDFKELKTQATSHFDGSQIRILFKEDNAYWIKDNALYVADVEDGTVVEESSKIVDTMGLDKVELEEMIFIVEKLTEGKNNDSSGPRDKKF